LYTDQNGQKIEIEADYKNPIPIPRSDDKDLKVCNKERVPLPSVKPQPPPKSQTISRLEILLELAKGSKTRLIEEMSTLDKKIDQLEKQLTELKSAGGGKTKRTRRYRKKTRSLQH
jgi:hypothetical protein